MTNNFQIAQRRTGAARRDKLRRRVTMQGRPEKKDFAQALLLRGSIFLHLDPRVEGVSVPQKFRTEPQLVLQFGFDLPVAIPDLRIDETGAYGTLSFNRVPFPCCVSWDSVFAITNDNAEGLVWQEDMPSELRKDVEVRQRRAAMMAKSQRKESSGKHDGERPSRTEFVESPLFEDVQKKSAVGEASNRKATAGRSKTRSGKPLPEYLRIVK